MTSENPIENTIFLRSEEIYLGAIIGGRGLYNTIRKILFTGYFAAIR